MPWALEGMLEYFKQKYGNPPMFIHESGNVSPFSTDVETHRAGNRSSIENTLSLIGKLSFCVFLRSENEKELDIGGPAEGAMSARIHRCCSRQSQVHNTDHKSMNLSIHSTRTRHWDHDYVCSLPLLGFSFHSFAHPRNGSDVRGYFAWSFLDVFELLDGYGAGFGLYYVDLDDPDRRRYQKLSARWYSRFLKGRSVVVPGSAGSSFIDLIGEDASPAASADHGVIE